MHVTILRAGGKGKAIGREAGAVNGAEMANHFSKLFVVDNRKHFHFEAAHCCVSRGHIFRVLAAGADHVEPLVLGVVVQRRDRRGTAGLSVVEGALYGEGLGVEQLCSAILASGHEHGVVVGELEGVDFFAVHLNLFDELIVLQGVAKDLSVVGGDDKAVVSGSPNRSGEQVIFRRGNFLYEPFVAF